MTARVEAHVAEWIATSNGTPPSTDLAKHIPPLLTAIEQETAYPEDAFEASVCLAWVHYTLGEPALALSRLPKDIQGTFETILESTRLSRKWIQVCAVKGGYIKGQAQEKAGSPAEAARVYHSIVPILPSPGSPMTPQLGLWTNRLLTRLCELSTISQPSGESVDFSTAIGGFRLWVQHWQSSGALFRADQAQRDVWVAYYRTLSEMLRMNILCDASSSELHPAIVRNPQDLSPEDYLGSRLKQMAELKRAETANERILLENTTFPQASERNTVVESWIEEVMDNWRILCGPTWHDEELGSGGKEAIARGVLDVLYRAATKTFHSPQILRHLFTVHSYLTEFDLAVKAFDSYLEIMNRGRERDEKTGEEDLSLDTDDAFIWTNAEAIKILCRYGSFREAERAENLCDEFESWLKTHVFVPVRRPSKGSVLTEQQTSPRVSSRFAALAHHAVGTGRANWARWTHDVAARAGLQANALQSFRKALDPRLGASTNVDYLYSLAFQLAEMRDLPNAIKVAKQALAPRQEETSLYPPEHDTPDPFQRERSLMRLWHLLALLLSSRGDYAVAAKACEAAFDQFHDASVFFGGVGGGQRESTETDPGSFRAAAKGIISGMDGFEKESILQIKMTQIALTETMEGAALAVESTGELFALFANLFGSPDEVTIRHPASSGPPPSSNGTVRASIFGRKSLRRPKTATSIAFTNADTIQDSRPATSATHATRLTQVTATPTIQVTGDDGTSERRTSRRPSQSGRMSRSASGKLQKRQAQSMEGSVRVQSGTSRPSSTFDPGKTRESTSESPQMDKVSNTSKPDDLPAISHNLPHTQAPPPVGHQHQPPRQDTRLPTHQPGSNRVLPQPRYPQLHEDRRKMAVLVQIWLFVAGLYTRAGMVADAKSATDEAAEIVQKLEVETLGQSTSARALSEMGWTCSKSVDELWGDVWAEVSFSPSFYSHLATNPPQAWFRVPGPIHSICGPGLLRKGP